MLAASFPDCFPPGMCSMELKRDHFYGGLSKQLKAGGSLPEGGTTGENILRLP